MDAADIQRCGVRNPLGRLFGARGCEGGFEPPSCPGGTLRLVIARSNSVRLCDAGHESYQRRPLGSRCRTAGYPFRGPTSYGHGRPLGPARSWRIGDRRLVPWQARRAQAL